MKNKVLIISLLLGSILFATDSIWSGNSSSVRVDSKDKNLTVDSNKTIN